jgi:hypothetical protein
MSMSPVFPYARARNGYKTSGHLTDPIVRQDGLADGTIIDGETELLTQIIVHYLNPLE